MFENTPVNIWMRPVSRFRGPNRNLPTPIRRGSDAPPALIGDGTHRLDVWANELALAATLGIHHNRISIERKQRNATLVNRKDPFRDNIHTFRISRK